MGVDGRGKRYKKTDRWNGMEKASTSFTYRIKHD